MIDFQNYVHGMDDAAAKVSYLESHNFPDPGWPNMTKSFIFDFIFFFFRFDKYFFSFVYKIPTVTWIKQFQVIVLK